MFLLVALVACGSKAPPVPPVKPPPAASAPQACEPKVTTPSGLQYCDLVVGTGMTPAPGLNVTVHYTGWLLDNTKFDSSRDRGEPFTFAIGMGQVIRGWDEGVGSMAIGGHRILTIPASLAYGERDLGDIPPNSTLVFDVELLSAAP
jgi:peptidylprolyl isomerase